MENRVTIDGKEYQLDQLSEAAKGQLGNVRAADMEISRLRVQLALAQTARAAYAQALREALPQE